MPKHRVNKNKWYNGVVASDVSKYDPNKEIANLFEENHKKGWMIVNHGKKSKSTTPRPNWNVLTTTRKNLGKIVHQRPLQPLNQAERNMGYKHHLLTYPQIQQQAKRRIQQLRKHRRYQKTHNGPSNRNVGRLLYRNMEGNGIRIDKCEKSRDLILYKPFQTTTNNKISLDPTMIVSTNQNYKPKNHEIQSLPKIDENLRKFWVEATTKKGLKLKEQQQLLSLPSKKAPNLNKSNKN